MLENNIDLTNILYSCRDQMKNDCIVMKSAREAERRGKKPRKPNLGLSGAGKRILCFDPCRTFCLFQSIENFCSLVSAQGVYLF